MSRSRHFFFLLPAAVCCLTPLQDCLAQKAAKIDPFVVDAQNYAVIDLSALSTNNHAVSWLALDDSNNAAFGINQSPTGQPAELDVYTYTNGGTTPAQPLILTKTDTYAGTQYQNSYTVTSLLASGKVFGYHNYYFKDTSPQNYSGNCYNGFSAVGNTCSDASMPSLFLPYVKKPYTQLKCTATDGSYAGIGIYANTMFDPSYPGDDSGDPAAVDFIVHAGVSDCFAPFAPTSASNASTRIHTQEHFAINAINAKGWALGVGYDASSDPINYSQYSDPSHSLGNQIWNADQQQFVNLDTPAVAINDDNDVLVSGTQDSTTHRYSGAFLFEKGDTNNKHYFLPNSSGGSGLLSATAQPHFRNLQPLLLSNRVHSASLGVQPVLYILFKAEIERSPATWSSSTFLLRLFSDDTSDLQEVIYPDGVTNIQLKSVNSKGLISAIGNPGSTSSASGNNHALLLMPVNLVVDANRDGAIKFSGNSSDPDLSGNAFDTTSQNRPYKFWINNNHDGYCTDSGETSVQDDLQPGPRDCDNNVIACTRDLEDFTRLWISMRGMAEALKNAQGISAGLQWKPLSTGNDPAPAIKIFNAVEANGGTEYVTDPGAGNSQLTNGFGSAVSDTNGNTIVGTNPFALPKAFWNTFYDDNPKHLIFEGVNAGKGKLILVFLDSQGNKIGEGGALYVDLRDIKNMYERWSCEPSAAQNGGEPSRQAGLSPYRLPSGSSAFYYQPNDPEDPKYILFVHGWNMDTWQKDGFAETTFKRLWWQGYQGRFGAFQWPTTYGRFNFDGGEFTAWKSASALEGLFATLNNQYSGNVHVLAHSQGNVAVGEALRKAAQDGLNGVVADYIASQAAIPVHCYDPNQPLPDGFFGTPRDAGGMGIINVTPTGPETPNIYPAWLSGGSVSAGSWSNFFNVNDYALSRILWETDQAYKPNTFIGPHAPYFYAGNPNNAPDRNGFYSLTGEGGSPVTLDLGTPQDIKDRYEIMAFAAEARCHALGATNNANGFSVPGHGSGLQDLWWTGDFFPQTNGAFSAHPWHSAEFRFTNAYQKYYWQAVLKQFGFKSNIPSQDE